MFETIKSIFLFSNVDCQLVWILVSLFDEEKLLI